MRNHIILYRSNNTPGKSDATGAFEPEARALAELLPERYPRDNVAIRGVDLSSTRGLPKEEKQRKRDRLKHEAIDRCLTSLIEKHPSVREEEIASLSYFCHGWRRAVEFELGGLHGAHGCAEMLVDLGVRYFNLFACSTGKPHPEGNFAQWVAQACADRRHPIQIMAHETSGHTSWNAKLRVYWSLASNLDGPFVLDWQGALDRDQNQLLDTDSTWREFAEHMKQNQNYRLLLPFMLDE